MHGGAVDTEVGAVAHQNKVVHTRVETVDVFLQTGALECIEAALGKVASTQVEVLEIVGATARVRTTVTVFDAPLSKEIELVLIDGRWYGKDAIENMHIQVGSSES